MEDLVVHRFGSWRFSPYDAEQFHLSAADFDESLSNFTSTLASDQDANEVQWINEVSQVAQSGIPQAVIVAISVVCISVNILHWQNTRHGKQKASSIRWPYEVASQATRAASLALLTVAHVQGRAHLLNSVAVAYAFALGLLRWANNLHWRHAALHQVNFVMTALLLTVFTGQVLPCIERGATCARDPTIVAAIATLAAAFLVAIVTPREWVPPRMDFDIPGLEPDKHPSPEETCSWLNYYCTYEWLTPVIWKGTLRKLDIAGIPKLSWYDDPLYLLRRIQKARSQSTSTFWTVMRYQRKELSLMGFWICLAYILENVAPLGLFKLLDYLGTPNGAVYQPWVWLLLMFFGPLSRSVCFQQYVFTSTRLIIRIKSGMTQELYHRALESMELEDDPFEAKQGAGEIKAGKKDDKTQKSTSAGRLANLMAADVDALYRSRDIIMITFGVPAGTAISLYGLWRMLGWPSLVGTAILTLATPLSLMVAQRMYLVQRKVRKAQDSRISLVTEYLASIRAIKYFAWEDAITEKIVESRAREQKEQWRVSLLTALMGQITQLTPYVSLLFMLGLYVGVEAKRLDASTAFTTIFLVKNIRRNIMQASHFSRNFAGAMVSFGRLDKYFESTVPLPQYPIGPLRLEKASFRRNKKATFQLENISLDFAQGGLNVVGGPSGSGKSTLMLGILGETYLEGGVVTRPDDVAYASQSSWLQNNSIKDNILFGSAFEKPRYDRVIEACCLPVDFREVAEGEDTMVGENGTALSGGQKARVALARALYSKAPLLLLDDIFSALDAKTAAGVWKHCFCTDLLKGRTTILVTNVPWIAAQADVSITMDKGEVSSVETNIGVVRQPITIAEVLGGDTDDLVKPQQQQSPEQELNSNGDALNDATKVADEEDKKGSTDLVNQEMKASGKIGRLTFIQYMGYWGHPLFAIATIAYLFLSNVFSFVSTFWLSVWVEAYDKQAHVDIAYYMGIFCLFSVLEITSFAVILITFEWGAWNAGKKLHNDFIRAIMHVSLSWFKKVPVGRITNRFAGDIASIDGMLSSMLRATIDAVMTLLFRVGAVSTIMPIFMLPALFTCIFGIVIGEMYTRTAVVIKRLTSSAQSPVFSQFADTLAGLSVIRARAGMAQTFGDDLAQKLRIWSASAEANYNCNRWVAVRVDFVTALVALSAGIIAVSQTGLVAAGLVGFSLTNANGLSQTILMLVRAMNDLEVEMQSFHRVNEYLKLEPEEKDDEPYPEEGEYADDADHVIPKNWPTAGEIEFRDVTIRYDPDGPDVLTDVNLKFKAGERVAVVGRTGSGKSTLVISLLRFTHVVSGQILFDGIDITKIPRHRLRESLTIIPQEAVLFSGTVESNLDPTGLIPPARLERALENCRGIASFSGNDTDTDVDDAATAVESDAEDNATNLEPEAQGISLSTSVDARGENFSHGQRQVLSLCRALIRDSKLMLLDEATASMDYETDRGIQEILRRDLEEAGNARTLVTIAHRLRTIIDYDTVVVMGAGKVVECGSPRDLYESRGQFYDMMYHSGEMEELQEMFAKKE